MRVLSVYKDVHPLVRGGIERYVHDLSAHLARRGHEVEVLVAGRGERERYTTELDGFAVRRTPCLGRVLSNPVCPELHEELALADADVVHVHLPLPSAVIAWLAAGSRLPCVVTYHSDIVRQAFALPVYGPFLRRFLRSAYAVLATSPVYAGTSPFLRGLPNVRVVPIGVDCSRFSPGGGRAGEYALFVGRFRSYKGIDVLLDAWRPPAPLPLLMAGGGPMLRRVSERAMRERLRVRVVHDPDDRTLLSLYRGATCLVLPSTRRSEAYGMVQLEAMACGVPVVSTDLPTGVPWVNRNGVTGLVVPPGEAAALAAAVSDIAGDPGLRERLSRGALVRAREELEAEHLLEEVESVLEEASWSGRRPRG